MGSSRCTSLMVENRLWSIPNARRHARGPRRSPLVAAGPTADWALRRASSCFVTRSRPCHSRQSHPSTVRPAGTCHGQARATGAPRVALMPTWMKRLRWRPGTDLPRPYPPPTASPRVRAPGSRDMGSEGWSQCSAAGDRDSVAASRVSVTPARCRQRCLAWNSARATVDTVAGAAPAGCGVARRRPVSAAVRARSVSPWRRSRTCTGAIADGFSVGGRASWTGPSTAHSSRRLTPSRRYDVSTRHRQLALLDGMERRRTCHFPRRAACPRPECWLARPGDRAAPTGTAAGTAGGLHGFRVRRCDPATPRAAAAGPRARAGPRCRVLHARARPCAPWGKGSGRPRSYGRSVTSQMGHTCASG